jgi:hypothetical protein
MTKRGMTLLIAILTLVFALPLHADFGTIARAIDDQSGVKRIWIPFLGIARAVLWVAHPEGVHDFQLATFEGGEHIDPRQLQQILRTQAGPGFVPLVRTWRRDKKEWSFIYAKAVPNSTIMELMIVTHDSEDTVLVRVEVDANIIAHELREPRSVAKVARR